MTDVKVVAPMNMGTRLVWDEASKKYNVDVDDLIKRIDALDSVSKAGDVAVLTGEIAHEGWLPIPAGFAEHECRFFISPSNSNPNKVTWDWNENTSGMHYRTICELSGRQVNCQTIVNEGISGGGAVHKIIAAKANYLVIGVKQ